MSKSKSKKFQIEVFRPGTFTPMVGGPVTYSEADVAAIAESYDADVFPAPVVVGHPTADAPAFAWIESLTYDGDSQRLFATVSDVVPAFAEALAAKAYRKVSMAFFPPNASNNPKPGAWHVKHLGFLGGAAPAVPGLATVSYAGDTDESVVFVNSAGAIRDTASMFRRMRDFMIDNFGLEKADEVLPGWEIDWLDNRADDETSPRYSEKPQTETPEMGDDPKKTAADDAAFAEREGKIAERENNLAAQERKTRLSECDAFCEQLIADSRLLPAKKAETVALLDFVGSQEQTEVSFAGPDHKPGDAEIKQPALDTLKSLLKAQPKQVAFGATDLGDAPGEELKDGKAIANAAKTYRKQQTDAGNDISFSEAVEHIAKEMDT